MAWSDAARAAALEARRRNGKAKGLGVATSINVGPRRVDVKYHNTNVVTFGRKAVILRTGGYSTATTKKRMNQVSRKFGLGYSVYQKNFQWHVVTPKGQDVRMGSTAKFRR